MIALDTNVLVRFLVKDDEDQHRRAVALLREGLADGETFFVPDVVLAEVVWVLSARYRFIRTEISVAMGSLLSAEGLDFESAERCYRALARFDAGRGGFADYLISERATDAGCEVTATFDRMLLREPGFLAP